MKTKLLIMEGYASQLNENLMDKDEATISHLALPILFKSLDISAWKQIHSTRFTARRKARKWLFKNADKQSNLFVICKSMGVVKMRRVFEDHPEILEMYNKVVFVAVDGHSKLIEDILTFQPPYGKRRDFKYPSEWVGSNFFLYNVYQQVKWPHGAKFNYSNSEEEITDKDVTHMNIIKHPTVLKTIQDAANWLKEG